MKETTIKINRKFTPWNPFWALLFAAPLLSQTAWAQAVPKTAAPDPQAAAKAKLELVNEGELRLDGKITAVLGTGMWQVEASSWTSPRGVTTEFDEPKNLLKNP